MLDIYITL